MSWALEEATKLYESFNGNIPDVVNFQTGYGPSGF